MERLRTYASQLFMNRLFFLATLLHECKKKFASETNTLRDFVLFQFRFILVCLFISFCLVWCLFVGLSGLFASFFIWVVWFVSSFVSCLVWFGLFGFVCLVLFVCFCLFGFVCLVCWLVYLVCLFLCLVCLGFLLVSLVSLVSLVCLFVWFVWLVS
jgi:hypothetical protein